MIIDAHQHFWKTDRGDYGWLTPAVGTIYRDFVPSDLAPMLRRHGISGTVLVQAAATVAETEFMLKLASEASFIKGVVGWVDFESSDASSTMERLKASGKLVGVRPMIQDLPDDDWMLQSGLQPAFKAIIAHDLVFDALVFPRHLSNLQKLLAHYPAMRVVIDHGAKPSIRTADFDGWAANMSSLARDTQAYCKISGLVTEAGESWTAEKLKPYVDHLIQGFGPSRLIWGSDWPVCTLAATYDAWFEAIQKLLSSLSDDDRAAIMGGNAIKVYKLKV